MFFISLSTICTSNTNNLHKTSPTPKYVIDNTDTYMELLQPQNMLLINPEFHSKQQRLLYKKKINKTLVNVNKFKMCITSTLTRDFSNRKICYLQFTKPEFHLEFLYTRLGRHSTMFPRLFLLTIQSCKGFSINKKHSLKPIIAKGL